MTPRALLLTVVLVLAGAAGAGAAGGPVPPVQEVAATAAVSPRFVEARALPGATVLERGPDRGRAARLPGTWGLPAAAYDGSMTGISADGRRAVLDRISSRFPVRTTRLAVYDVDRMRLLRRITLRGAFSVDAVSPTGRWIYLVHYRDPDDPFDYEVRAYDVDAGRLLARRIVDPTEPDEDMAGLPLARVTSPDGRWAYTLYSRPDGDPFVHALDTAGVTARCIDLETIDGDRPASLVLEGTTLTVDDGATREQVDTRTLEPVDDLTSVLASLIPWFAA